MNQRLVGWIRTATGVGFTGGVVLIALGLAGLSASFGLAVVVLALGGGGILARRRLQDQLDHPAFAAYLTAVPLGPLLAGAVILAFAGASSGELQTLGSVCGLLAILNHMLRPVYAFGHYVVTRTAGVLG
ncbi:MAG: hypothetical protein ABEI98_12305 [Halorhabdus sp.]